MANPENESTADSENPKSTLGKIAKPAIDAFDAVIKVTTGVNLHAEDAEEAKMKALQAGAIDTTSPVAGLIPANAQHIIRGNQSLHIKGNRNMQIDKNDLLDVGIEQRYTITNKATYNYGNDRLVGIVGNDKLRVIAEQKIIVLGKSEEHYIGHHEVNAPTEVETKNWEGGITGYETKFTMVELASGVLSIDIGKKKIETWTDLKYKLIKMYLKTVVHRGELTLLGNYMGVEVDSAPKANAGPGVAMNTPTE